MLIKKLSRLFLKFPKWAYIGIAAIIVIVVVIVVVVIVLALTGPSVGNIFSTIGGSSN